MVSADAAMTGSSTVAGIGASLEPVDWNPSGLPSDPHEVMSWIVDPARRGELYPLYHRLRQVAPVYRNRPELFHGAWMFSRFADCDAAFRNPRVVNDPRVVEEAFNHGDGAFQNVMRQVMLWQQPEPHQRVRNLVKAAFTQRAIARFRPVAQQVANRLCDRIEGAGHAELVSQFNYELPFNVIAKIIGIPEDDFPLVKQLAWDFARAGEKTVTPELARRGDDAARGFETYFAELAESRRLAPADDLLSSLLEAEADGERLSHVELIANCILLLQAGHETTQDLLGNAQVALFRHRDQLRLLQEHPDMAKNATEEFLRYDTSVQINHRVALDATTAGSLEVDAGDMVYVFLGAINRDPEQYAEPDRLDITRQPNHHLAFSFGAYYCLGAALARTEIAVGTETMIERFPGLRPATGEFEWRDTLQLRGPLRLEVTW
jgi:pimeloyl-[acyl-carrier protein] synthase